jgi:hypothetical protein
MCPSSVIERRYHFFHLQHNEKNYLPEHRDELQEEDFSEAIDPRESFILFLRKMLR